MSPTRRNRLSDLPLWRLLVALHDAESVAGPRSESVEALREAVEDRMRRLRRPRHEQEDSPDEE